jgi:SAM-dependent methyltransferase
MSMHVSEPVTSLYDDYYFENDIEEKRALSAKDSVEHILTLRSGQFGKLLDVGAGNGSVLREVLRHKLATEACALEISASGIEKIKNLDFAELREVRPFDGYHIPYDDETFDTAICIHVMEHVEHERMLLREIARVAKDIFLEVPLEGGLRGRLNYSHGHINYYTPLSFRALIETSGLEIVSSRVFKSSSAYEQHIYGGIKGRVRNMLRNLLLKALGPKASELMTYLMTVHCRPVRQ